MTDSPLTPARLREPFNAQEVSRLRAKVYGIRIADDPNHPAAFVVVCPKHRVLGSNLTISNARLVMERHVDDAHRTIETEKALDL